MIKKSFLILLILSLAICMAFGSSSIFDNLEKQILNSKTFPEIRSRIIDLQDSIDSNVANLEKRISFYEGRHDEAGARAAKEQLVELKESRIKESTIDYCLDVLDRSGYSSEKVKELRIEMFDTLDIKVSVTCLYSTISKDLQDSVEYFYPLESFSIPRDNDLKVAITGFRDANGRIYNLGSSIEIRYDDILLTPIWNTYVHYHPGNDVSDFSNQLNQDTEFFELPSIQQRGNNQSSFYGWKIDSTIWSPGDMIKNPRDVVNAYGVWVNYDVTLNSIEEVDGNGDFIIQGGETVRVFIDLITEGPAKGDVKMNLYSPSELDGKVLVSGKTEVFPVTEGILVQFVPGFSSDEPIKLIAVLEDSKGNTYYRDIEIGVNKSSLDIEIGDVSYNRSTHELFIEVKNNSRKSSLVSPEFTLSSDAEIGTVRTQTIPAGSSAFISFYFLLDDTRNFKLEYTDRFENKSTMDIVLDNVSVEQEEINASLSFSDYSVKELSTSDGLRTLRIELAVFNNGELAFENSNVGLSLDGINWSSYEVKNLGAGQYATSSGSFQNITEVRNSFFGLNSHPIEIKVDPKKYPDRVVPIDLRFSTPEGKTWFGHFNWTLEDTVMDLQMVEFSVKPVNSADDILQNGERFGIKLALKNNGLTDLSNVILQLSSGDPDISIDGKSLVVSLLKAGETTVIEYNPKYSFMTQLSGTVSAELVSDKEVKLVVYAEKPGKDRSQFETVFNVSQYKPDFNVVNVFINGKESFERVYASDSLNLKPVIEYKGEKNLENLRCVISSDSVWVTGKASLLIGNLIVGKSVPSSFSKPSLKVAKDIPMGIDIPLKFEFADSSGRSWVSNYTLISGRSTYNFQIEDIYTIGPNAEKLPLTASRGSTVEIGFATRNIARETSPMMNVSLEVLEGPASIFGNNFQSYGTVVPNTLIDVVASDTIRNRPLLLKINDDAQSGSVVRFKVKMFSLLTVVKTQEFELTIL